MGHGTCNTTRPGTLGYQRCWLPAGHEGLHRSQDREEWPLPGPWNVVDCGGAVVWPRMFSLENAQMEADDLNANGLPEGRPYRVEEVA